MNLRDSFATLGFPILTSDLGFPILTSDLARTDHTQTKGIRMRIGVLTDGDCPGLNAVIRAFVRMA
jgi:hypothetical protein